MLNYLNWISNPWKCYTVNILYFANSTFRLFCISPFLAKKLLQAQLIKQNSPHSTFRQKKAMNSTKADTENTRKKVKYTVLTIKEKVEIIEFHQNNSKLSHQFIAEKFSTVFGKNIKRRTVGDIIEDQLSIKDLFLKMCPEKRVEPILKYPSLDMKMIAWV